MGALGAYGSTGSFGVVGPPNFALRDLSTQSESADTRQNAVTRQRTDAGMRLVAGRALGARPAENPAVAAEAVELQGEIAAFVSQADRVLLSGDRRLVDRDIVGSPQYDPEQVRERLAQKISELVERFEEVLQRIDQFVDAEQPTALASSPETNERIVAALVGRADGLFEGIRQSTDRLISEINRREDAVHAGNPSESEGSLNVVL